MIKLKTKNYRLKTHSTGFTRALTLLLRSLVPLYVVKNLMSSSEFKVCEKDYDPRTRTAKLVRGFTLLEILLVVAAIAILAGIVIVALNPAKQLGDTRNAERRSDVNTVLNAVYQYVIDNSGTIPTDIDTVVGSSQVLGTDASGCDSTCTATTTVAACVDLSQELTPTYIVGIPTDPSTGTALNGDYYINRDANGRITVGACDPEQSATISVTR